MATTIRAEISKQNKYWISKHRYYELKHFCLQYPAWRKAHKELLEYGVPTTNINNEITTNTIGDPTAQLAITKMVYTERIELIEKAAMEADPYIWQYILKAVTEGCSYTKLKSKYEIPCSRDLYYDRYRRFFWILSRKRS